MRSVIQRPASRLFDRIRPPSDGFKSLLRTSVGFCAPFLDFGRPTLANAVESATRGLASLGRRLIEPLDPVADTIQIRITRFGRVDAGTALDLYAGTFTLAGSTVRAQGRLIFEQPMPSRAFTRKLHGFAWFEAFAETDAPLARLNAAALLADWLQRGENHAYPPDAFEPSVIAERVMSWLVHADWLMRVLPHPVRAGLLTAFTRDVRLLRRSKPQRGIEAIRVAVSLIAAAIAVPAFRSMLPMASKRLDKELRCQVLPDGGHISRCPSEIVALLAEILPLRDALIHAGVPASTTMMNAIDRMLPMVRYFLGADGTLAQFNGTEPEAPDLLAAVLSADDAGGSPHGNAAHSGYQRLNAGSTIVILDSGMPPPYDFRQVAHAGTLSFELCSGANRFVINCGTTPNARPEWRAAARATAAHSTLILAGKSSANPIETGSLALLFGKTLVGGPRQVLVDRREHAGVIAVVASHDGYARTHNLIHERTLRMAANGGRLDGRDLLMPAEDSGVQGIDFVARFHLGPLIEPVLLTSGVVMLIAPDGEAWEFHAEDRVPELEASVCLSDTRGPIPTRQIVLTGSLPETTELRWSLVQRRGPVQGETRPAH